MSNEVARIFKDEAERLRARAQKLDEERARLEEMSGSLASRALDTAAHARYLRDEAARLERQAGLVRDAVADDDDLAGVA